MPYIGVRKAKSVLSRKINPRNIKISSRKSMFFVKKKILIEKFIWRRYVRITLVLFCISFTFFLKTVCVISAIQQKQIQLTERTFGHDW